MKIAVYCEQTGNGPLELLGKARSLRQDAHLIALCESEDRLEAIRFSGANEAIIMGCVPDDCVQGSLIAKALKQMDPDAVLFPATVRGRFLSSWVAAKLNTGLTADCTQLALEKNGLLRQIRPAFGGNLTAHILCKEKRPQMASVRPGVFPLPKPSPQPDFVKSALALDAVPLLMQKKGFTPSEGGLSLQAAPIIVAGGKGIGSKKGFEKLFELAHLLGGAVGATRSAVDAGFIPYAHQIGQTGITVRPQLYIAFGISGLIQHTVGMNGAKTVIAVNTDKSAPIFSCADYGILADWESTADAWIKQIKERKPAL